MIQTAVRISARSANSQAEAAKNNIAEELEIGLQQLAAKEKDNA